MRPPGPLVVQLRALERPGREGLRWTREDQWHVTVAFLASVDPDRLVGALDSWAVGGPAPVMAVAGPRPGVLAGRVWAVPVAGLEPLAASLARLFPGTGRRRPFHGHLTLARARCPSALSDLPAPPVGWAWEVTEVEAVRSRLQPDGAHHETLGRWLVPGAGDHSRAPLPDGGRGDGERG